MIHCPKCQAELPQDARFCNRCGFNQTDANMVSILQRMAQPAAPGTPAPPVQSPSAPAQPFAQGKLPITPVPGKDVNNGPYDTVAQVSPPDTPPARRLSLRERYQAEQAVGSQAQVPSQPLPQPAQAGQPAAGAEGQGRTRLSHFISKSGAAGANASAPQQPQRQPGNNDDQGWIEPEQRYRQNQVIRTSTPRPPMPTGQPQPIVRVSTPPARPGPGAPGVPPVGVVAAPPQPQPRSYSLDTLLQQNGVISNASHYALERWRQGWWERQHAEAAPAVGVSRGQAAVPEPLMRMQHSIARMRAVILPKKKDNRQLQIRIGLFTIIMIALIAILIIYNLLGTPR